MDIEGGPWSRGNLRTGSWRKSAPHTFPGGCCNTVVHPSFYIIHSYITYSSISLGHDTNHHSMFSPSIGRVEALALCRKWIPLERC